VRATGRERAIPRRRPKLVAIAPSRGVLIRALVFAAGFLLEPIARILVHAARPPVAAAFFSAGRRSLLRFSLGLRRFPQTAAREPLHDHVRIGPPELRERRQQFLALTGPKRSGLAVDENRPVRVTRRHISILAAIPGSNFGNSTCFSGRSV
jgi:hypothetical protein